MLTLSTRAGRANRPIKAFRSFGVFLTCLLLTLFSNLSLAQSYDFHQARNNFQNVYAIDWVGGILNATHTDYFEGQGIPQRVIVVSVPSTPNGQHSLQFKVLAQKGTAHAYDFLVSWEQAWRTARDIGNGNVNELASLASESGGIVTINSNTAWGQAISATAQAAVSGLTHQARADFPDQIGSPTLGGDVNARIACFETVYGNRQLQMLANSAISNLQVDFDHYDSEYAFYNVTWTSSATNIALRFAGHAAIGVGQTGTGGCIMGYGEGKGAGSISGGPYHFKLLELDGASIGQQDNQLQSGAIQIPPTCGFTGPALACPNTASLTYQYQGSNAANANLTFTFLTNTANATFANNGTMLNTINATANSSGAYTLTVYPRAGGFTAGGDIQVQVTATTNQGTCTQAAGMTHIQNVVVTATASPAGPVSLITAPPHYSLNVSSITIDGVPASLSAFSYSWTVDPPQGGSLSANNIQNPTFSATTAGAYTFRVNATQNGAPGCSDFDAVTRELAPGSGCPQVTGGPLCANATGTFTADRDPAAGETWVWSANNGASISGPNGGKSVSVTAGTSNFSLLLTISYANTALASTPCPTAVTVKPRPVGSATGVTVCSGDQASINLNSDITGTTFTWTASVTTAPTGGTISGVSATGSGSPIVQTLTNSGTTNGVVTYVVTPSADGCPGTPFNVTITVKPRPVGTPQTKSICSGENTNVTLGANISSNYTWTASLLSGTASGFSNGSGGTISQVLTNTTTSNAVVRYSVVPTANDCAGAPFNVDVTVRPRSAGTPQTVSICSGENTNVTLGANITSNYTWTASLLSGTATGFSNGSGGSISQVLTNTGTTNAVVRYSVTPTANDCAGQPFNVDVTVKPRPVGSATGAIVCSGDQASINLNSNVTPATFAWTASVTTAPTGGSITGVTASGSGTPIVQTLSNSGTSNGVVTYVVTPTADGCAGAPFNVTITVKPRPVGTPQTKAICSGDNTNVTLGANITSTYTWNATLISGSASGFSGGSGNVISQVLTNTGTTDALVRYSVTPTADGCAGTAFNVDVTVKPRPTGSATPQTICSGAATSVNLNSNVTGTTFTWTAAQLSGSVSGFSNGSGSAITQTLTGEGVVRYTVTPTAASCPGNTFNVDVTVQNCDVFCTYTQGAYGSVGGMSCNGEASYSTYETITRSINAQGGMLRVGKAGKSITITAGPNGSVSQDVSMTVSVLPGGGQARMFNHANDVAISNIPSGYLKNGRINNNLLSQTITLGINLGVKSNLGGLVLKGGTIATAETVNGCGDNTAKTRYCCIDPITLQLKVYNEYRYRNLDPAVIAALDANPANRTVAKLFDLANRALSNTDGNGDPSYRATTENGVSLTAIMNTVDAINNAFDGCRVLVGFNVAPCASTEPCSLMVQGRAATQAVDEVVEGRELKVTAYPNPFSDRIRFTIASPVSGQAQLEVFNMMGQKVATVFNGTVQANRNQVVEYRVPSGAQQNLMYLFRVGDQRATGKLLNTGNR